MMIGVAQVIGMKPTLRSLLSSEAWICSCAAACSAWLTCRPQLQPLERRLRSGSNGLSKVDINCSLSAACRRLQKVQSLCHDPGYWQKGASVGEAAIGSHESRLPASARGGECMQGAYKVAELP